MREQRHLGLDVGERRIGVALSDASGRLATPLTTIGAVPQAQAIARIAALCAEHEVVAVVIGLRAHLAAGVALPIDYFDERLTSAAAEQLLREMGVKPEKRKLQIDQVAASIILQDYLDSRRNGPADSSHLV
jgi:putative holliday junction resolvase